MSTIFLLAVIFGQDLIWGQEPVNISFVKFHSHIWQRLQTKAKSKKTSSLRNSATLPLQTLHLELNSKLFFFFFKEIFRDSDMFLLFVNYSIVDRKWAISRAPLQLVRYDWLSGKVRNSKYFSHVNYLGKRRANSTESLSWDTEFQFFVAQRKSLVFIQNRMADEEALLKKKVGMSPWR